MLKTDNPFAHNSQPVNALEADWPISDNPLMNNSIIGQRLRMAMGKMSENELAKRSGVPQSTIHRILTGESKDPRRSNLERLASVLGMTYSELIGDGSVGELAEADRPAYPGPRTADDEVHIPQFDTGGMGGNGGLVLKDQPGIIQNWSVSPEWLRANVPLYTSLGNLCLVTGFGDSMPELYNPGDPVLVDKGVRAFDGDGIYFFRVGNIGFIKRLQLIGSSLRVISQNKEYEPWTMPEDADFEVLAKVLKAWKSRNI